jgi:hypothetical protein
MKEYKGEGLIANARQVKLDREQACLNLPGNGKRKPRKRRYS